MNDQVLGQIVPLIALAVLAVTFHVAPQMSRPDSGRPGTFPLVAVAASLALSVTSVVAVTRMRRNVAIEASASDGAQIGDSTEDTYWKWGQFYCNPSDPALFVEKRVGIGWTFNYGHAWAWPLTSLIILAVLAPVLFGRR